MGVAVDIFLANEKIAYHKYDLLHFFNITRPADFIRHIKLSRKPYVVSTIFVDYREVSSSARQGSGEYLKVIGRAVLSGEKVVSNEFLLWGHKKSVQYVAKNAAYLLPNSESEYKRFVDTFSVSRPYMVVPNGVDVELITKNYPINPEYKDAIICMGRIEPRKNQLALIHALNGSPYKVFIHGKPSPNHKAYYQRCISEATENIFIRNWLDTPELYRVYRSSRVHVLPSYFETTGLVSLEAAAMGCSVVITDRGDTKEYFGDNAWYCDPANTSSIRQAVDEAFNAPVNEQFRAQVLERYTWDKAAKKTMEAYQSVLNRPTAS